MAAKKALIVDDSKSARAFLSRILEKYEVAVDTAESAEQALEYLGDHRPDVIFMDHLMPGMDGFQALQSIKNNPRTAMIPIMMYTSQEGELYLGQARALGAIGVLPKQIKPADVSRVLYQLRILPDRRGADEQTTFKPVNATAVAAALVANRPQREPPQLRVVSNDATAPSATDLRALVESVVEQHMGDLHRAVSASLDAQSERLLGDVRVAVQDAIAQAPSPEDPGADFAAPRLRGPTARWAWGLAALGTLAAAALGTLWWLEATERRELATQLVASKREAASLLEQRDSARRALAGVVVTPPVPAAATADAIPRRLPVPYGELALSGERLDTVRTMLARLQSEGFRGAVAITTYPGRYCLQKSGEGYALADDAALAARCDLIGNPFEDALSATQREPLAFANYVGSIRQQSGGAIRVQFSAGDADRTAIAYPATGDKLTAGEWNRAAAANNRIDVQLLPAATGN
jgi:CheY-like chemotaxis protein